MKSELIKNLACVMPSELAHALVDSYEELRSEFRHQKHKEVLFQSGRFAENVYRILHYFATAKVIPEVKKREDIIKEIEKDTQHSESIRILIPRIAGSMIYDPRSKKDAVHVKEVTPDLIDSNLVMTAATWIVCEFIREFHTSDPAAILQIHASLMRATTPLVQEFEGKPLVMADIGAERELLVLLHQARNEGMDRTAIGFAMERYKPPTISNAIKKLFMNKKIHRGTKTERYFITSLGEQDVSEIVLFAQGGTA